MADKSYVQTRKRAEAMRLLRFFQDCADEAVCRWSSVADMEGSLCTSHCRPKSSGGVETPKKIAAFQRPCAYFTSHMILSTIMHHMQAFYYPHYLLDHVLHALSAPLFPATICTEEHQESAQAAPPPCSFPMASRKGPRIHCRKGPTRGTSMRSSWRLPSA